MAQRLIEGEREIDDEEEEEDNLGDEIQIEKNKQLHDKP